MGFDAARLMLSSGIASEGDLARAREVQGDKGGSLPRTCYELGILDEARWVRLVAKALSLPTLDLDTLQVESAARGKAPDSLLRELVALPYQLKDEGRVLGVAMAEPQDDVGKAQLRAATGCELEIGVAGYRAIELALSGRAESLPPLAPSRFPEPASPPPEEASESPRLGPLEMTPELARILETLGEAAARSGSALRAAVDLCLERRLFTADDLKARLGKKR